MSGGGGMISRSRTAFAMALVLALSACSGTPTATEPIETEDIAAVTPGEPAATVHGDPTPAAPGETTGALDDGNGRPVQITLVLSGTSSSDGSYSASGPARLCGNGVMNLTGNPRAFQFGFPLDGDFEIEDVTFSADDLVPGSSTPLFHIGVNVKAKLGGEPPATVVQPDRPESGDTGNAQLSEAGGTRTLVVQGTNDFGDTISLTAICAPGQG